MHRQTIVTVWAFAGQGEAFGNESTIHSKVRSGLDGHWPADAGPHESSMLSMVFSIDVCKSSGPRLGPIAMPRNSRENSEHKKQYWTDSVRAV